MVPIRYRKQDAARASKHIEKGIKYMKFELATREQDFSNLKIVFNHEELKTEIAEAVQKYKNIVYTDENIGAAKEKRAELRKFVEGLEERRKIVKKLCMMPYEEFDGKMKELTALVNEPINLIDSQVKDYENRQKAEKQLVIQTIYHTKIGILKELLPLSALWNDKWLNATYKIADIRKEIEEKIDKAGDDLAVIIDMGSEFGLEMQDKYLQTLDLGEALKEKSRLEEQKKRLYAYGTTSQGHTEDTPYPPDTEKITFTVIVTKEQKAALRQFFLDNAIDVK